MLQHVAACCSVLQRAAACCSVLKRVAAYCGVLQRVALGVLHCVLTGGPYWRNLGKDV